MSHRKKVLEDSNFCKKLKKLANFDLLNWNLKFEIPTAWELRKF